MTPKHEPEVVLANFSAALRSDASDEALYGRLATWGCDKAQEVVEENPDPQVYPQTDPPQVAEQLTESPAMSLRRPRSGNSGG